MAHVRIDQIIEEDDTSEEADSEMVNVAKPDAPERRLS